MYNVYIVHYIYTLNIIFVNYVLFYEIQYYYANNINGEKAH